jgi:hypothetical protein
LAFVFWPDCRELPGVDIDRIVDCFGVPFPAELILVCPACLRLLNLFCGHVAYPGAMCPRAERRSFPLARLERPTVALPDCDPRALAQRRPWFNGFGSEPAFRLVALRGAQVGSKGRGGEKLSGSSNAGTAGVTTPTLTVDLSQGTVGKDSSRLCARSVCQFAN